MRPIKTKDSNHNFGPPLGREEDIGDLPCEIFETEGHKIIYSVWELDDDERAALVSGGKLKLGIHWIGAMPPVSLNVIEDEEEVGVNG